MSNLKNIVNNKIISYLDDSSKHITEYKFILALSGGVDSMVLFKCLNDLGLNFYTLYFNHNQHAESENISIFLDLQEMHSFLVINFIFIIFFELL